MLVLKKSLYLLWGLLLVGVGIVGAFLPLLPSTIFFILAAYCFARSSPRLERWVLEHRIFGPPVVAWKEHRAIPRKAKYLAFAGMMFGFVSFVLMAKPEIWLFLLVALFFLSCAIYVGTRPDGEVRQ
ncbi:YbaN family protein [uncultured Cohaesibacter sp.]|uniref:YbaN family protein n=1 Tax=uncultured Cohaesibacter sp. TaxID=1002546 RepID=UPI0029315AEB|nr:YbaN family protein [uncultured Cohaesibacter sp.]